MRNDFKEYKRSSLTIKQKLLSRKENWQRKQEWVTPSFPEKIKIKAPRSLQVIVRREVVTREALNKFRKWDKIRLRPRSKLSSF